MPRQREHDRAAHYLWLINYLLSHSIPGDGPLSWSGRKSQDSEGMTLTESLDFADAMNREMWETIYSAPFDHSIRSSRTRLST